MKIFDYVKSFLPSIEKDDLLNNLSSMQAELDTNLEPTLKQVAKTFKGVPFKSDLAKGMEETIRKKYPYIRGNDLFEIIGNIFKNADKNIDVLEQAVNDYFERDLIRDSVTYRHATIVKAIELYSFVINYTTRNILRVLAAETMANRGLMTAIDSQLTKSERKYLDGKYIDWVNGLTLIAKPTKELKASLVMAPDMLVQEGDHTKLMGVKNRRKMDPLSMNFIAPEYNPIYHFRMHKAEMTVARINSTKEERRLVELRLRDLKNSIDDKNEAHLEKKVEVAQDRLNKLDFKIAKLSGAA